MDRDSTASALPEAKGDAAPPSPPLRRTGEFSCSNHLLNILAERMIREQERIFSGPTPPDRATLLLLSEAAGFALDLRPLFLRELAGGGLAESYAGVVVLDQLYCKYGETEAVRQYLPAAAAHLETAEKEISRIVSLGNVYVAYFQVLNTLGVSKIDSESLDAVKAELDAARVRAEGELAKAQAEYNSRLTGADAKKSSEKPAEKPFDLVNRPLTTLGGSDDLTGSL